MAITSQDNIESVSQAMFLTVPGKGLSNGDQMQSAGLFRGISAYHNLGGNPWIITGPIAAGITTKYVLPMTLRWVNPQNTLDEIKLLNTAGEILWHSFAVAGQEEEDVSMRGEVWVGIKVPTFKSGILYIYVNKADRYGPGL